MAERTPHTLPPWWHHEGCIYAENDEGDVEVIASLDRDDVDSVFKRNEQEAMVNIGLMACAPELLHSAELLVLALLGTSKELQTQRLRELIAEIRKARGE